MAYGLLVGPTIGQIFNYASTPETVTLDGSSYLDGITLNGDSSFQFSATGNIMLQVFMQAQGIAGAQTFWVQVHNKTTGVVSEKINASIGGGEVTDSQSYVFPITVSNIAHTYEIRIRLPELSPANALKIPAPGLQALVNTAAGAPSGNTEWTDQQITAPTTVLTQSNNKYNFGNSGAAGAVNLQIPSSIVMPWECRLILADAQEMRITPTGGTPFSLQLEALGSLTNFCKSDSPTVGDAIHVILVNTTTLYITQLGGVWSDTP